MKIGIMQGRLLPPVNNAIQAFPAQGWQQEFSIAGNTGLDCIEFIFDGKEYDRHPLMTQSGIREIRKLQRETGVSVLSVCADLFMTYPLHRGSKKEKTSRVNILQHLIRNCAELEVRDIVVPCVDSSRLRDDAEKQEFVCRINECLPVAQEHGINLALETDLGPEPFAQLVNDLHHDHLTINYDTGNSASLGYDPTEEFAHYGQWITDIHIKDRLFGGSTVPLGTGDVDFSRIFSLVQQTGYHGILILQTARKETGCEQETIKGYLDFIGKYLP